MKTVFTYTLFAILFLCPSCRTLSYFESPNNLRNIDGMLYLQDGKSYEGKLVVETENLFGRPVKLYHNEEKKPMQFSLSQIKAFSVRNELYELKEIREGIALGKRFYFMKRMTPENSRIHLFEFLKKETVNKTATRLEPEYYIQLPNEKEEVVYASNSTKFVPNFEEKVSRLVADCPILSQKIAEKRPGYFYAQVNLLKERRADILLKIINEYNQCGK